LSDLVALQTNGGLRNGDQPRNIYDMWNAPGTQYNLYRILNNNQLRFTAFGSADIGNHAISVGVEYEQRVDRGFVFGNITTSGPVNLWTTARLLTNNHISNLDFSNPEIDQIYGQERFSYQRLNSSPGEYN